MTSSEISPTNVPLGMASGWQSGPAAKTASPVLVSATEYTFNRFRDIPGIILTGMRMRRILIEMHGAVGVTLYAQLHRRRVGSMSVWESEADLHQFVVHPKHIPVMAKYRKIGTLRSATWRTDRFVLADAWREAERRWAPVSGRAE